MRWPDGHRAAVVFTIDDVFPGRSTDAYEAGGDLGRGVLGHLRWLLDRHPRLHATLFTAADWREISPVPTRDRLPGIASVDEPGFEAPILPKGTMALDRHPAFVGFVRDLPRTDVQLHGLHHVHTGPRIPVEFQDEDEATCRATLAEALAIFDRAGLPRPTGMCPPAWNAPDPLIAAMADLGLTWVASARDIRADITPDAVSTMSGRAGMPLVRPEPLGRLLHFPTNFQATSTVDRALAILDGGGLLSIKAHAVKNALGFVALDGLDGVYANLLDLLFRELDRRYGDSLLWTSMARIAEVELEEVV
ncbi:MAG: hypothetical protein H0V89_02870 [Deltaproteobacteria bacterium]|nr:hypothetical protein [Deltaproteobacteria bacterium]